MRYPLSSIVRGERVNGGCRVTIQPPRRNRHNLPMARRLRNHSPNGAEWGYGGSGPAQLALALCALVAPSAVALAVYQHYKSRVVAHLPHQGWRMTLADVRREVEALAFEEELQLEEGV